MQDENGCMVVNTDPGAQTYWDTWDRVWGEGSPTDDYLEAITKPIDELVAKMMEIKPTTIAGLGVWARAMMVFHAELWCKDPDVQLDDDSSEEQFRALIEVCAELAGVSIPAEIKIAKNRA